jgi:rod shape-determining protein MreC
MTRGKKRSFILLFLALVALALMTYQYGGKPVTAFQPLTYPYDLLNNLKAGVNNYFRDLLYARGENRTLKKEVAALRYEKMRHGELSAENSRLRDLLALREREKNFVASATVVSKGYDRVLNLIIIDKGAKDGVLKGMAVVTAKGLAGKVYSVSNDFSKVLLLKDANFSAAVRLRNSRREGVISGSGDEHCILKYIPPEETVVLGEEVITSGLDGIFPPGLPVGVVDRIKKEGVEFFQRIDVLPFQSDSKLEEVAVLKRGTDAGR